MSGPKTTTLKQQETKEAGRSEQQCAPPAVCCETIREAAYFRWEAAGCPCGDGVVFWLQAEAELVSDLEPEGEASKACD